jgi:hypothetical protein
VRTRIVEAVQSKEHPGNWGKFLVGAFDEEHAYESRVDPDRVPLLRACGWWGPERLWVLDIQTGEGAYFNPGGLAAADLAKHRIWVCPLFSPFLEWLYERHRELGGRLDLDDLPEVVELPDAEFALYGYRRPGPEEAR